MKRSWGGAARDRIHNQDGPSAGQDVEKFNTREWYDKKITILAFGRTQPSHNLRAGAVITRERIAAAEDEQALPFPA